MITPQFASRTRHRSLAGIGAGLAAALIASSSALAAVGWGTVHRSTADYAYTTGRALARTVTTGGTAYLHQVATEWVIKGTEVTDSGPYLGIYYTRGNGTGSTWSAPRRLNSSSAHGEFARIASRGKYVYVAWRRQPGVSPDAWNGVDPRPLQFRRNINHGSSTAWEPQPIFVSADRIDRPSIAATGSTVWIAYTDAIGGEVRLQKSTDSGKTFHYTGPVGVTSALLEGGFAGWPIVAATGSTVAVAWFDGTNTRVKISTDAGLTWKVDTTLEYGSVHNLDAAGLSGKVVFAWSADTQILVRRWNGSSLAGAKAIVTTTNTTSYKRVSGPSVALSGTSVIGIAYTACTRIDCSVTSTSGRSIRWIESRNAGSSWTASTTIGAWNASASRRENEFPAALWAGPTRRVVSWTAFGATDAYAERSLVRIGDGT
jgi:hypothetical protein